MGKRPRFEVQGSGSRVRGLGFGMWVWGLELRGSVFRAQGVVSRGRSESMPLDVSSLFAFSRQQTLTEPGSRGGTPVVVTHRGSHRGTHRGALRQYRSFCFKLPSCVLPASHVLFLYLRESAPQLGRCGR